MSKNFFINIFVISFYFFILLKFILIDSSITVLATGDLMMGAWAEEVILEKGFSYPFDNIREILSQSDIVFTNVESPFGVQGKPFDKTYTFQVKPQLIEVLSAANINLVSLGNNHIMDFGLPSLEETIRLLKSHRIYYAGAGINREEACQPARLNIKGMNIAFFSYNLTFPKEFWATDSTAGTCFPSHTFIYEDIARSKEVNDYVIVSCHWGEELMDTPKQYQIELAHKLIDSGADLILGHHPHVLQGIEVYEGKLIAYSLGNFIFGSYSENARESMMLKVYLGNRRPVVGEIVPINIYNREVEFQPRPLEGIHKRRFLEHLNKISGELNKTALVISTDGEITVQIN